MLMTPDEAYYQKLKEKEEAFRRKAQEEKANAGDEPAEEEEQPMGIPDRDLKKNLGCGG